MKQDSELGRYFAIGGEILLVIVVAGLLASESLKFFFFAFGANGVTPWMAFGLTGGAVLVYLPVFLWNSNTTLKQFVSLTMLLVCIISELITAGFGMRINAFKEAGVVFTKDDIENMILFIQVLGGVHAIMLVIAFAGDRIIDAFKRPSGKSTPATNTIFDPLVKTNADPTHGNRNQ